MSWNVCTCGYGEACICAFDEPIPRCVVMSGRASRVRRLALFATRWLVIAICFPIGLVFLFFPSPRSAS